MTEEVKVVAGGQEPVKTPDAGVETNVPPAPTVLSTEDYEAALKTQDAIIERIDKEKDNYRRGILKAKGKLPDDPNEESPEDTMRRIAREELLNTQSAQAQASKEELVKKMAKENSELKLALKNRTNITVPSGGSAGSEVEPKNESKVLSDVQRRDLAVRFPNWTEKDYKEFEANLQK